MKLRNLIIASIILLALGGGYYWSEHHKPTEETTKASTDAPPAILKLDDAAVTQIEIKKKDAEPLVLTKAAAGWQISAPKSLRAEQSAVSGVVSTVASLNSERLVEQKAGDLKRYGLEQPSVEVNVSEKSGKTHKLLIGDEAPTGGTFYAMLAADPRVFTIAGYTKSGIDKNVNDLRDKRLLTVDFDKLSRLQLIRGKQEVEFGRNKQDWQIVRPRPSRADNSLVEDLIRKLSDAKMDLSGSSDAAKAPSAFAAGTPVAVVKLTDESGTQELQVRKSRARKSEAGKNQAGKNEVGESQVANNEATYYAKSSAVEGVYKVDSDLGQALDKGLDDFRNRNLFDFSFNSPNKIEWQGPSKSYVLFRNGEDWSSNGTSSNGTSNGTSLNGSKLDPASIEPVISELRELKAGKLVDSGFGSPTLHLTVTSDDGKRVEKVSIAKSGDNYVAKRENEATLYQLDAGSVDSLKKAIEGIKPLAVIPKSK